MDEGRRKRLRRLSSKWLAGRARPASVAQAQAQGSPWHGRLAALLLAATAASCAAPVRVESLATGQADRQAFQLFGNHMADLRRRADELCPEGVEVWRSAESRQDRVSSSQAGGLRPGQWLSWAADAVTPNAARAQLVVSCLGTGAPETSGHLQMLPPAGARSLSGSAAAAPRAKTGPAPSGRLPVTDYD